MATRTTALILCLGAASRMRPLSLACAKALLPFCGRPLLEYTLEQLRRHGVQDVVLGAGPHNEEFQRFESWGRGEGMDVRVVRCDLNGSAGAIKRVSESLGNVHRQLLVIYGDSLFRVDLKALLIAHAKRQSLGCEVTIAYNSPSDLVIHGKSHTNYGILTLEPNGRCVRFVEKPAIADVSSNYASTGIFVINRKAIESFPANRPLDFSRDFLEGFARGSTSPVFGYEVTDGYRFDIGTIQEYVRRQFDAIDGAILLEGAPWGESEALKCSISCGAGGGRTLMGMGSRITSSAIMYPSEMGQC